MRPLDVQFAEDPRWPFWVLAALALLAAGMAIHQGWHVVLGERELRASQNRLRVAQQAMEARQVVNVALPSRPSSLPLYARDAEQYAQRAAFDVGRVLTSLETAKLSGVRVVALEVVAADRSARVELAIDQPELLMKYLEVINAGETPPRWVIVTAVRAGGGAAQSATISARWPPGDN